MHKRIRIKNAFAVPLFIIGSFILHNQKVVAGWRCTTTNFYVNLSDSRIMIGLSIIMIGYLISLALLSFLSAKIYKKTAKKQTLKWPSYTPYLAFALSFILLFLGMVHYYYFAVHRVIWQSSDILCKNLPTQLSAVSAENYKNIIIVVLGSLIVFWSTYLFARVLLRKVNIIRD